MITEIFLPEKIGSRRIISQRILGVSIQDNKIYGALIHAKRSGSSVEQLVEEIIELEEGANYEEQVALTIKKLIASIGKHDYINIAIPSSMVIFKELEVPFTDNEKIRMILDYEIEPMLPFSLDHAVIDFIITHQDKDSNSSQILAAAVRNQDLQQILNYYLAADINPNIITIDLFSLYSLYQQIPDYYTIHNGTALVDLGMTSTQISFLENGKLRLTRFIPRGIKTVIQSTSKDTNITPGQILNKLQTFGIKPTGDDHYDEAIRSHMTNFFNDIQFTLNSFSLKLNYYKGVQRIFFAGNAAMINNLVQFSSDLLQIQCELFKPTKLFGTKKIKNSLKKQPEYWSIFCPALGCALIAEQQQDFTLRRKEFSLDKSTLIGKQLFAALALIIIITLALGFNGYLQMSSLQKTAALLEKREIEKLITTIPRKQRPRNPTLRAVVNNVKKTLKNKEELWAPFEKQRLRPLEIMLELTTIMDKDLFNIEIENLSITEKTNYDDDSGSNILIDINGFFMSKRGTGYHFREFRELEQRFEQSTLLMLAEPISPISVPEKGIEFNIRLKKKED